MQAGFTGMERDEHIYREAEALWFALFTEPPPPRVDAATLLDIIARSGPVPQYEALRSPHLRPTTITGPRRDEACGDVAMAAAVPIKPRV